MIEQFNPAEIVCLRREAGKLTATPVTLPAHIKLKAYSSEVRLRFAEALLARRILLAEGDTEALAYPAAARRLAQLEPQKYASLEAMGIAVFNTRTDSQIAGYGTFFRSHGKTVFAVYDKQADATKSAEIEAAIDHAYEFPHKTFEELLLKETAESALRRFATALVADGDWPTHLAATTPKASSPKSDLLIALQKYFSWRKAWGAAADLLSQCTSAEMPATVKTVLAAIKTAVQLPPTGAKSASASAAAGAAPPSPPKNP